MPLKLAASQYPSAVLLGIAGQTERGKYAAHSRPMFLAAWRRPSFL